MLPGLTLPKIFASTFLIADVPLRRTIDANVQAGASLKPYCLMRPLMLWICIPTQGRSTCLFFTLKSESFWAFEVPEKTAEVITELLVVWAESLGLDLSELTFLTDRGGEFAELSPFIKDHVKTASYHPEANGKIERRHKEVSVLCRLYDCDPPAVAEMWHIEFFKSRLCLLLVISS